MTQDFYCDEVLNGKTPVQKVLETDHVLAFYHTRPFYQVHLVVVPKTHISSLLELQEQDTPLLLELLRAVQQVASKVHEQYGACRVITNIGDYQDSKHLHFHVIHGSRLPNVVL